MAVTLTRKVSQAAHADFVYIEINYSRLEPKRQSIFLSAEQNFERMRQPPKVGVFWWRLFRIEQRNLLGWNQSDKFGEINNTISSIRLNISLRVSHPPNK